jgi:hypothetical protein
MVHLALQCDLRRRDAVNFVLKHRKEAYVTGTLTTYSLCLMKWSEMLTCFSWELQIESMIEVVLIFSFFTYT